MKSLQLNWQAHLKPKEGKFYYLSIFKVRQEIFRLPSTSSQRQKYFVIQIFSFYWLTTWHLLWCSWKLWTKLQIWVSVVTIYQWMHYGTKNNLCSRFSIQLWTCSYPDKKKKIFLIEINCFVRLWRRNTVAVRRQESEGAKLISACSQWDFILEASASTAIP